MNLRNGTKRLVQLAWLVTLGGWIFAAFHAADRDPWQWPSAMFATLALFAALALTALYWVVVVSLAWIKSRPKDSAARQPPPDP